MSEFSHDQLATRTQEHLNKYITVADQKASILLTGQFAFLGLATTAVIDLIQPTSTLFWGLSLGTATAGILAAIFAIFVIYPRTPKPSDGYIYWGSILEFDSDGDFHDAIVSLSDDQALESLVKENYSLAEVAQKKFRYLRWSLRGTLLMISLAVVSGIVFLI